MTTNSLPNVVEWVPTGRSPADRSDRSAGRELDGRAARRFEQLLRAADAVGAGSPPPDPSTPPSGSPSEARGRDRGPERPLAETAPGHRTEPPAEEAGGGDDPVETGSPGESPGELETPASDDQRAEHGQAGSDGDGPIEEEAEPDASSPAPVDRRGDGPLAGSLGQPRPDGDGEATPVRPGHDVEVTPTASPDAPAPARTEEAGSMVEDDLGGSIEETLGTGETITEAVTAPAPHDGPEPAPALSDGDAAADRPGATPVAQPIERSPGDRASRDDQIGESTVVDEVPGPSGRESTVTADAGVTVDSPSPDRDESVAGAGAARSAGPIGSDRAGREDQTAGSVGPGEGGLGDGGPSNQPGSAESDGQGNRDQPMPAPTVAADRPSAGGGTGSTAEIGGPGPTIGTIDRLAAPSGEQAPAPVGAAAPTDPDGSDQLWRQVRRALGSVRNLPTGEQQLTIRLRPAELGSVTVRISTGEAGTAVALVADSSAAANQLTLQRHSLISELEQSGLRGVAVDVGTEGRRDHEPFDRDGEPNNPGGPQGAAGAGGAPADGDRPASRPRSQRGTSAGLVDLDL